MKEFWDTKFNEEKTNWGFIPSDSAILTKDFFVSKKLQDILIPGIGYGRNAKIYCDAGMKVDGIEISKIAIDMAKSENELDLNIYHGSVTDMPFNNKTYDGIFCYALIHLLNKHERNRFIQNCYKQLRPNGYMFFTVVSKKASMYGNGKFLSTNRYKLAEGLNVFFYDHDSITQEFIDFGLIDFYEIDEPIKHIENEPPLKCYLIKCQRKD